MLTLHPKNMRFLLVILISLLTFSCNLRKELVYFQPTTGDQTEKQAPQPSRLKIDDIIAVDVTALDPEAVKVFNPNSSTTIGQPTMYTNGVAARGGYLIDANGDVTLPLTGKINVVNLTTIEASKLIQEQLSKYVTEPIVFLRILNFKITVLGEVRNPGTYTIPNERITLPEALGLSGDLNITGVRTNVLVIREVNGQKTQARLDLTDASILNSPYYYLQQNDVIYVEPNRAKRNSALVSATAGVFISVASLIVTTVNLLVR